MREQIVERKSFNIQERIKILEKTNDRCAHCGCRLNARSSNFSVEHIIPISKGGTHDEENLIALCFSCNQEKSNFIINPAVYYKYVQKEYLPAIVEKYRYYQQDVFWFQRNNFFAEDAFEIRVPFNKKPNAQMVPIGVFKKAIFDDLDDIYKFVSKYHDKYDLDKSELKDIINRCYQTGAIYTIRNSSGIIAIFPVTIEKGFLFGDQEVYYMRICGLPCCYPKYNNGTAIYIALKKFIQGLCEVSSNNECVLEVQYPKNDAFIGDIIDFLRPEYEGVSADEEAEKEDAFTSRLFLKTLDEEGGLKEANNISDEGKKQKVISKFSKFLQRSLKLKEIK